MIRLYSSADWRMGVSWRRAHSRMLVACTILLAAFLVRLWRLTDSPLWYDETFVLHYAAGGPIEAITGLLAQDNVLPLHGFLLSLWVPLVGQCEFALRLSSALAGTAVVALVGKWAGEMSGRRLSWGAMVAVAISPIYVYYSQETRYPALSCALAALFGLQAWRLLVGRGSRAGYVVSGVAMLLAHPYTALLWLVFLGAGLATHLSHRKDVPGPMWWSANGALVLVALPVGAWLFWRASVDATALARSAWDVPRWLPIQYGVGEFLSEPWNWLFPTIVAVSVVIAVVRLAALRRWAAMAVTLLGLVVPVPLLLVASRASGMWSPRYLLFSWGLLLVIAAGWGWDLLRRRWRIVGALLALGCVAIALPAIDIQGRGRTNLELADDTRPRPDFRSLADYIQAHEESGDVVVVVGGHAAHTLDYHYEGTLPLLGMPDSLLLDTGHMLDLYALPELEHATSGADRIWLVLWQDDLVDPNSTIQTTLSEDCAAISVGTPFLNVGLLLFDVRGCRPLDTEVEPPIFIGADFASMRLLGYEIVRQPETLLLDLWWEATTDERGAYTAFVHLVGTDGRLVSQYDWPPSGVYPTAYWEQGMRMRARHPLPLPSNEPCCGCVLRVGLYSEAGRLLLPGGEDAIEIALQSVGCE